MTSVQGEALGGFRALLSFDYIVAERGATFGLPDKMFVVSWDGRTFAAQP